VLEINASVFPPGEARCKLFLFFHIRHPTKSFQNQDKHFRGTHVKSFIHFHTRFSSQEGLGISSPRATRNTSRFSAISDNSGSTRKLDQAGRRCNHATWSLVDLWASFPWLQPVVLTSPVFAGTSWSSRDRTIVAEISIPVVLNLYKHAEPRNVVFQAFVEPHFCPIEQK